MASVTPRASGFWADTSRMNYFPGDEGDEDEDVERQQALENEDGRTRLDKTIDRIGMGSYQWALLSLCGFGWMADNMWIQAVAIILPRVQQHYEVPDSYIGTVSSSMFAGMMFGAIGWGTCSDLMGRSAAFNATLFFTSVFGLLASFASSFPMLCVLLFLLGSAVGGSMPTDGTLLLEHMPQGKQYLVTALSVFFSFGAVLSAIVALLVVPQHSCKPSGLACDVETENQGWKYMLVALGLITLTMFLARIAFFRLHESPRYLVHAGRPQEALESLQLISRFNGSELSIKLEDVDDHRPVIVASPTGETDESRVPFLQNDVNDIATKAENRRVADVRVIFDAGAPEFSPQPSLTTQTSAELLRPARPTLVIQDYNSIGESPTPLETHTFSPVDLITQRASQSDHQNHTTGATTIKENLPVSTSEASRPLSPPTSPPRPRVSTDSRQSRRLLVSTRSRRPSSYYEKRVCAVLPRWIRRPLFAWFDRIAMVLSPEWRVTTILVWAVWCFTSLAYTMFNVYLPKLLETRSGVDGVLVPKSLEDSLWDVVIFTIGGCPGAILGAYLVESPWIGRRWALAGSTFVTAFFCIVFVLVQASWAVRTSTVCISLSATAMWAVLYGWTPEIFGTKVRGTACGIASALSRVGGMIAPMLGGMLLMINSSVPVYTSVVIFVLAGACVLCLQEDAGDTNRSKGERIIVH